MTSDRFWVAIFSLALILVATGVAMMALGWTAPAEWMQALFHNNEVRIGAGVVALLAALLGLKLLGSSLYRPKSREGAVVYEGASGKVHIALGAMESLILKAAKQIAGVKEITPRIKVLPNGVAVMVKVSVTPDLNIPAVSEELQQKIKSYVEETAGIQVLEVKVIVEAIAADVRARVE